MDPETPEKSGVIWTEAAKHAGTTHLNSANEDGVLTVSIAFANYCAAQRRWSHHQMGQDQLPWKKCQVHKNIWTRINKQIADLDTQENNGEPTPVKTPRKKGPAKKKTSKAMDLDNSAVDDDLDIKQEFLKKRGAEDLDDEESSAATKRPKVKPEANDDVRVKKENAKQY
ncbi:hypothetical protein ACHAPV_001570 [Trichoderma viride]